MEGVRLKVAGKRKIVGVVGVDGDVWELMGGEEEGGWGITCVCQVMLLIAKRQRCRTVYGCIYVDYQSVTFTLWGTLLT